MTMPPIRDAFLALLAAVAGVAVVISVAAEAGPYAWGFFLVMAVTLAAITIWDAARAPRVLLVGDPTSAAIPRLENALSYGSLAVRHCCGPGLRPCPVDAGERCPYADHLAAGLVLVTGDGRPDPPCERALGIPVLFATAGPVGELAIRGRSAPATSLTQDEEIVHTVQALVAPAA
jgi:hypothetical protein